MYLETPKQKGQIMKNALKIGLFIVDPQNCFMGNDDGTPYKEEIVGGSPYVASLPVAGAVGDMRRLIALLARVGPKIRDIRITLDSHHTLHIAHPNMWRDENGRMPAPFTIIRADDVKSGIWRTAAPQLRDRFLKYLEDLEASGKFLHCIWPEHGDIGGWQNNVFRELHEAVKEWERTYLGVADYVTKGSSVFTEHFGALMAQVPDPNDPSTQLNADVIVALQELDLIVVAGEASSHCVKTTVEQVADNIGDEHVKKMVLLTDCMSPVPAAPGTPDFPAIASDFLRDMAARGMTLMKADEFLA